MAQPDLQNHSPKIKEPSLKIPKLGQKGVAAEISKEPISLLRVKKLSEKAVLPSRGSPLSAGYDLSSAMETKVPARGKALVPFEFNGIAQKWDTIQIEDLKLDNNEVPVVNSMYSLKYLLDETVVVESPRNVVLILIRKMNPHVFIQGVVNAAHGVPFFTSRFRQALFHFSTLFEMLDTYLSRYNLERMLLESESYGPQAMNFRACEGSERIERSETYKQWLLQNVRAGFRQLPLNQEMMNSAKDR